MLNRVYERAVEREEKTGWRIDLQSNALGRGDHSSDEGMRAQRQQGSSSIPYIGQREALEPVILMLVGMIKEQ